MLMMESVSHPLNKIRYSSVGVWEEGGDYRPGFSSFSMKSRQEVEVENESSGIG